MIQKKSIFFSFFLVFYLSSLYSQISDSIVLFTVAGENIPVGEFKQMYLKNNRQVQGDKQDIKDYLNLYVNFKLKVHKAKELEYDTLPDFKKELAGYRKQLAQPYMINAAIMDSMARIAFECMKKEIHAHHILVRIGQPGDTAEAYNKIMEVRKKILDGMSFETMARAVSDDPSAKSNGGDLGFFTVFQMIYPFEQAAYALSPGEISMPIHTRFGYHLIRVDTILPNPGKIHVAHIMVAVPRRADEKTKEAARKKIFMIYEQLKKGEDFASLAKKYSDDYHSASGGGILPWFGPGRMIPQFAREAFAMKMVGDISQPVKTSYGWHIIKLLGRHEPGTFKELEPEIKKKIINSNRNQIIHDIHIRYLEKKYHAAGDTTWLNKITTRGLADKGRFYLPSETQEGAHIVLHFAGKTIPFSDFYSYLQKFAFNGKVPMITFINRHFKAFSDKKLLKYEQDHLEEEYPGFASVMKEYTEGMLMFNIMDKKVWSKAVKDTTGMKQFYKQHKKKYMTPEKMVADHYLLKDISLLKKVSKDIKKRNKKGWTDRLLVTKYNTGGKEVLFISQDTLERKTGTVSDSLVWRKGAFHVIKKKNRADIFKVKNIMLPRPIPLKQMRGVVTSDFQDYLEKEWVRELKKEYPVVIDREVFAKLKKELN